MQADNFNLSSYLKRIKYDGEIGLDLPTLKALMTANLYSVPFENTEVWAKRIPSLAPNDIVTKIVDNNHGGYCYEVNGLFSMALTAIGFKHYFAGARPMTYETRRPKTHMVIVVELDGLQYLCDVGFGGYGLREPLLIQKDICVVQNNDEFKLEFIDNEFVLSALIANTWTKQYGFALMPQEWIEFSLANYFNATSPDAIFTQKRLAILQTPNGRKILIDNELKIIENDVVCKYTVDYDSCAKELFGILAVSY